MSALAFSVVGSRAETYAAAPLVTLRLRVAETSGIRVHAIALRTQIQIEPQRRRYEASESDALVDLFGGPERYGNTLRALLWTHVSTMVVGFSGETEVELLLPCSYDFEVAAYKYLHALEDGEIPLALFFSGTVLLESDDGQVQAELVPWTCEARYRLPVSVYRATMNAHFPNSAWLRVHHDTFEQLDRLRRTSALPTWDAVVLSLLDRSGSEAAVKS